MKITRFFVTGQKRGMVVNGFLYLCAVTLVCNAGIAAFLGLRQNGFKQKRFILTVLSAAFAEIAALYLLNFFVRTLVAAGGHMVFGLPEIILFAVSATTLILTRFASVNQSWKRCLRICGLFAVTVFVLETTLFNYSSYNIFGQNERRLSFSNAQGSQGVDIHEQYAFVNKEGGSLTFPDVDAPVSSIFLKTAGEDKMHRLSVAVKTDRNAPSYQTLYKKRFTPAAGSYISLNTSGSLSGLQIVFDKSDHSFTIYEVAVNRAKPFRFHFPRYGGIVALIWAVVIIRQKKLWKISFRPGSKKQLTVIVLLTAGCMMISTAFLYLPSKSVDYPLKGKPDLYGPYIQQFDAFQKGQLHLDVQVDPVLAALQNPYDTSLRDGAGAKYLWDRAFYDGKYYSYFGVAPVILVYYPYYYITGKLPGDVFVCCVFALCAILFLVLLILTLVRLFCKKANFLLLLLGILTAVITCGIFIAQSCSDFYYIAVLSSVCFSFMFLFFSFYAYGQTQGKKRLLCLAAAGTAYVLIVASRPSSLLLGLVLVPPFLHILIQKNLALKAKISCALSFLMPVFVGGAAVMLYNALRFDSSFQFGAVYQLTVNDISQNTLRLRDFVPAMLHYFFQPLYVTSEFPFLYPAYWNFETYGRYVYVTSSAGAFVYPYVLSVFMQPALFCRSKDPVKNYTLAGMLLTAVLSAFVSFCVGGVNIRYTADIMPILSVLSVILILEYYNRLSRSQRLRGLGFICSAVLFVCSTVVGAALIFSNERGYIAEQFPQAVLYMESLFMI